MEKIQKRRIDKISRGVNALSLTVWTIGILSFLLVIFYILLIIFHDRWEHVPVLKSLYSAIRHNPGDLSWGTIGILLTMGSFLLMVMTFWTQRKQFTEQHKTADTSRFESTFFNLMSMFYNVRQQANKDIGDRDTRNMKKIKNIEDLCRQFLYSSKDNPILLKETEKLKRNELSEMEQENLAYMYGEAFFEFMMDSGFSLSYYFRYISNLIDYVIDTWQGNEIMIERYLDFIQAQMSDAELSLLFYNCLSILSKDHNSHYSLFNKLNQYNFLENLNDRWLIDRSNHMFYDCTLFKFLNNNELKAKKTNRKSDYPIVNIEM